MFRGARAAAIVAVVAIVASACSAPAAPSPEPVVTPEPVASAIPTAAPVVASPEPAVASVAPAGSPTALGSPGAAREASIRGSNVCVVNSTGSAVSVQPAADVGHGQTPSEAAWITLEPGASWCTAGYNGCTRYFSARGLDPATEDACGFIRVPDGGPSLWFAAVNPWYQAPRIAAEATSGPSFASGLDVDDSISMTANGVTITGKRAGDSDANKEFTLTLSR